MKFIIPLFGLLILLAACTSTTPITSFDDCVTAGNPIMESYPRQCSANGQTFVEEIDEPIEEGIPGQVESFSCSEQQKEAIICTMEYRPVCGLVDNGVRCITTPCPSVDANTFGNACGACAGYAYVYYEGACEKQTFVVCNNEEVKTGFNPKEHAERIGGICVDTCPGNYDVYMTQIGVQVCIEHYGLEEINSWETCDRSSAACDCVKAYETTANEEIVGAEYRCVPEQYANRLLFRSGLDRLDEKGVQSVMIA